MQLRTGRQVLVSTHSPSMFQDEGIGLDEILLLDPGQEGTSVRLAKSVLQIVDLLSGGAQLSDALLPYTRPGNGVQLSLFPLSS
jgi:hypothetical protein